MRVPVAIAVAATLAAPASAAAAPAPQSTSGSGTVLATQFQLSVTGGPFGESPSGYLRLSGAFAFNATATCVNVSGNAGVAGFRIDDGPQAGQGFLAAAQDTNVLYAGTLPTPPHACPPASAPQPQQLGNLGGGPVTGTLTRSGGPPAPASLQQLQFATPTPSAAPAALAQATDGTVWFIEPGASRIAVKGNDESSRITEFPVPTSAAGLTAIAPDVSGACTNLDCTSAGMWFTESAANGIGHVTPSGTFAEYPVPTAAAKPSSIAGDPAGGAWFTEPGADKIGHIDESGHVTEHPVPTANAQPQSITADGSGAWFSETAANSVAHIDGAGKIAEYAIPTTAGHPTTIVDDPSGAWFIEAGANKLGFVDQFGRVTDYDVPGAPVGLTVGIGPDGQSRGAWFSEPALGRLGFIADGGGQISELTLPDLTPGDLAVTVPLGAPPLPGYTDSEAVWFSESAASAIGFARVPLALGSSSTTGIGQGVSAPAASRIGLVLASRLTVRNGQIAVKVSCLGALTCQGRVLVRALRRGKKPGAILASAPFRLARRRSTTVRLHLSRAALRALRADVVSATVSVQAASGRASKARRVTLRLTS